MKSKFWPRLRLYLIGLVISSIVCYFTLWRGKEATLGGWFPNDRVISFLLTSKLTIPEKSKCKLDCAGVTEADLRKSLKEGKVDFDNSNTSKEPCHEYLVNMKDKAGKSLQVRFAACTKDSTSQVIEVYPDVQAPTCDCK